MELDELTGNWIGQLGLCEKVKTAFEKCKIFIKTTLAVTLVLVWYQVCVIGSFLNNLTLVKKLRKVLDELQTLGIKYLKDVIATQDKLESLSHSISLVDTEPIPLWKLILRPILRLISTILWIMEPSMIRAYETIQNCIVKKVKEFLKHFLDEISENIYKIMSDVIITRDGDLSAVDGPPSNDTFFSQPIVKAARTVAQLTDNIMNSKSLAEIATILFVDREALKHVGVIAKSNLAKKIIFGSADQKSLGTIEQILDRLKKFCPVTEMKSEDFPLLFNLKMLGFVHRNEYQAEIERLKKNSRESHLKDFKLHKHLSYYAFQIYQTSKQKRRHNQAKSLHIDESDLLLDNFNELGDKNAPTFAIIADRKHKLIVLIVRGTQSVDDGIIDCVCNDQPFLDGVAHEGILQGARLILDSIGDDLRQILRANAKYRLAVVGHSLGAGSAALLTMEMMSEPGKYIGNDVEIMCLCFAPPPVYRADSKPLDKKIQEAIHIYVNNQDCVPRLSMATVANLMSQIRAVNSLPFDRLQRSDFFTKTMFNKSNLDKEATDIADAIKEAVKGTDKLDAFPLEHHGKVHYLISDDDGKCLITEPDLKWFSNNLFVLLFMVKHHYHTSYNKSLLNAKLNK